MKSASTFTETLAPAQNGQPVPPSRVVVLKRGGLVQISAIMKTRNVETNRPKYHDFYHVLPKSITELNFKLAYSTINSNSIQNRYFLVGNELVVSLVS